MWEGLAVAIIGGDARETEMSYLAAEAGASVRVFGCPAPERPDLEVAPSPAAALEGARLAIMPVPYSAPDGALYAPFARTPIHVTATELSLMKSPAHVIIGKADAHLRRAADEAGVVVHEYENDTDLMLLRAPAIAEGAIRIAVEHSPVTIHGSPIGLVGFGRIGQVLARALLALNARLHVFARRAEARAAAYALGAGAHPLESMPGLLPQLEIVYNSAPAPLLGESVLAHMRPGTLVVDLAAPPGGVDLAAAEALGLNAVWARGLGASAPRSVARSQWIGVQRIARAALGGGSDS
ncbi:MAG: dipicolinate synthase subunit DpsA [Actinomycetota bacterium]